jgi:hypothetical protein
MLSTAITRVGAVVVLSGALVSGAAIAPASATPAEEAVYLTAMKDAWAAQDESVMKTTCKAYRIAPGALVSESLKAVMKDPASREALSRPAWKRVIVKYLAWACSGPGTTPR